MYCIVLSENCLCIVNYSCRALVFAQHIADNFRGSVFSIRSCGWAVVCEIIAALRETMMCYHFKNDVLSFFLNQSVIKLFAQWLSLFPKPALT